MNIKHLSQFDKLYHLISTQPIPCKVKRILDKKPTKNKCWLIQFLNGELKAIVEYTGHGAGGAVVLVRDDNNDKKDICGYFHNIDEINISLSAFKKYCKQTNNLHELNFNIFQ